MFPTIVTLRHDQYGRSYQDGALVDVHGTVLWQCGHGHYTTIYSPFSGAAQDCAEYERQKILRGR